MTRPCLYLGIDPGANGAVAVLTRDGLGLLVLKTPADDQALWDWLRKRQPSPVADVYAVLELVGGYVGKQQPGSYMFNFGVEFGRMRMALTAAGIPFELATPQRWQKALQIPPRLKTETAHRWKRRLADEARRLFPAEKIIAKTADAVLLAVYCRNKCLGKTLTGGYGR